jgi:hypothetical protein
LDSYLTPLGILTPSTTFRKSCSSPIRKLK